MKKSRQIGTSARLFSNSGENYNRPKNDVRKTLNLLIFEGTLSLPKYSNWQLIYPLHHRSGVFCLYSPNNIGSNLLDFAIGV